MAEDVTKKKLVLEPHQIILRPLVTEKSFHQAETERFNCYAFEVNRLAGKDDVRRAVEDLFDAPFHPYTQALLNEVPRLDKRGVDFAPLKGEIASPLDPPSGCHFHPRCPHAMDICNQAAPKRREIAPGRFARCHLDSK